MAKGSSKFGKYKERKVREALRNPIAEVVVKAEVKKFLAEELNLTLSDEKNKNYTHK